MGTGDWTAAGRCLVRSWRDGTAWEHAPDDVPPPGWRRCLVALRITGDGAGGRLLLARPEGCFESDAWHATDEEAMAAAQVHYGVAPSAWQRLPPRV